MENIVIGIEGLVGAGKTSICKELLEKIPNSILIHGGNLYRTIVYCVMKSGIKPEEIINKLKGIDIKELMEKFQIEIKLEDRQTQFYVQGIKVQEEKLQSKDSSIAVSMAGNVANNKRLFEFAKTLINQFKQKYNVILSGRALMEIYPELDYHFFITATLHTRIERKYIQYKGKVSKEEIEENIIKRDELQEKSGFYKIYPKTKQIDVTECKTIQESMEKVLVEIENK